MPFASGEVCGFFFFLYEKKTGEVVIEKVLSFDFTKSGIVSGNFFFFLNLNSI